MATRKKTNANRTTLVDGCGTILKNNRLSGGYKLVKRKRVAGASASTTAPKRKAGRPAKAKMVAPVTAPVKRRVGKTKTTKTMKSSVKPTAKRRGRRVSSKA